MTIIECTFRTATVIFLKKMQAYDEEAYFLDAWEYK